MIEPSILKWLQEVVNNEQVLLTPIDGGANNQGFRVSSGTEQFFLKCFEPHNSRSLSKLRNEYAFANHLSKAEIPNIGKPIAYSEELKVSLFSFIDGQAIANLTTSHIDAALAFIEAINAPAIFDATLPMASESPATLYGFVDIIDKRLERFAQLSLNNNHRLQSLLQAIASRTQQIAETVEPSWHEPLQKTILSPSDFGFHNAIETPSDIYFIDFEYAGRDTVWKLLSDFFAQPAIPVPLENITRFLQSAVFSEISQRRQEFVTIYELTLMKWCLIMLNEFIPVIEQRRRFSWNNSCLDINNDVLSQKKQSQLEKSIRYFAHIPEKIKILDKNL
ncbi:aminoglycoside phosphotransferase family protein [Pseudoalteromonas luteoviolacea]|uniref:aminoglycoside phosphotransferase family protein n=1 Tax=Pseudoalteromonas luteoviolacea TaxID=43657 RepID=UPI001B384756|nr:aminoglycoside phosphotransferase family protein [Pseudoalteromonas luteoviolacea]MBQ4836993.1 aminoglycoside phosphotransferase family protein [Pseudoalteromonas luteoviolacea]